ncbi:MAG: efflux RND transporter periplasmic adaptor subunit, partial [Thiomonas sp.]|nr:efflux RND transporter periplasmic adaptor subunit [Thiomonas sp.]
MTLSTRARLALLAALSLPSLCLPFIGLPSAFAADSTLSAQVQTTRLQRGELLHTLRTYAVVQVPASQTQAITFQHAMQVQTVAVHVGQAVRKGAVLATLRSDASTALAYSQAQTAVSFAQGERDRMIALKSQQLATQAQVDVARKALTDAQAQLHSLQQQGAGQAATRVLAPQDGIVLAVNAAPGDLLAVGSPLLQIGRGGSLQALAGVPPEDAHRLKPGQPVQLTSVFDPAQHWQGVIRSVGAAINPKTQRLEVQIALSAQATLPAAGTSVQADMVLGRWRGWVAPRDAVLQDERGAFVFQD